MRSSPGPLSVAAALFVAVAFLTPGLPAVTLTVSSSDDIGPASLRGAIAATVGGDEIDFDPSLAGIPIVLSTGELVIEKDVTINGLGRHLTIIRGPIRTDPYHHPDHRILVVRAGVTATLSSLSLVEGSTVGRGGAILNEGDLTLRDCELTDNFSEVGDGGAIANSGTLVLLDSALLRNLIEDRGSGSGLFNSVSGRVLARRTIFADNRSPFGGGAAIANEGYIEAEDCDIVRNRTFRSPGAIENGPGAIFHLKRSIVRENYALNGGGGAGNAGLLSITESVFARNMMGVPFGGGGGISNGGTLVLTNSTVHGNGVEGYPGGHGGGIYNAASASATLVNTTVTGNFLGSSEHGGGAGLENAGTAVVRGSVIGGNHSLSYCSTYPPPPEVALRSDITGSVESLGGNFVGGCTGLDPGTCAESVACGGLDARDSFGVDIGQLVESEPVLLWPWAGGSPRRGLLAGNAGPTPTVAPVPGSALIDSMPPGECRNEDGGPLITDQRGTPRPQGPACDAGSFEYSRPRGTGFWGHQCSSFGHAQLTPAALEALFEQVAEASPAFPECVPIGCDTLRLSIPQNDMRKKAERGLLAFWLNLITGRVTRGRPIDLPALTTAANAGEALAVIEAVVCDPDASRGDLWTAKEIAEAVNNQGDDMDLVKPGAFDARP